MDTFPDVSIEPMPVEADFESATFMEPPGAAPEKPKRIVSEKQKAHLDRIRASAVAARRAKAAAKTTSNRENVNRVLSGFVIDIY